MIKTPLTDELNKGYVINKHSLFKAIQDNTLRKKSCRRHVFSIDLDNNNFSNSYHFQCAKCGFLCSKNYKDIYELGIKHGKEIECE